MEEEKDSVLREKDTLSAPRTVILQARANMNKYHDCVVVTRVGGFYELYYEHADIYAPLMNLKVARRWTTEDGYVSMAGFPFFQLDRYLKILVLDMGKHVAIIEEFRNDEETRIKTGLLHSRRMNRIVTPGTLIDEDFIDAHKNNYVLAIVSDKSTSSKGSSSARVGISWLDLSTGHFSTQFTILSNLTSVLSRIAPREVVLEKDIEREERQNHLYSALSEYSQVTSFQDSTDLKDSSPWNKSLKKLKSTSLSTVFADLEAAAGNLLLQYIEDRLPGMSIELQPPIQYRASEVMTMDKATMKALELRATAKDNCQKGSLLHAIRRTVTRSGTRLLEERLCSPSTSIKIINARLDMVECMMRNENETQRTIALLKNTPDSKRLVQRFALGRGNTEDLLALATTVTATQDIMRTLSRFAMIPERMGQPRSPLSLMLHGLEIEEPLAMAQSIRAAISEDALLNQQRQHDEETSARQDLVDAITNVHESSPDVTLIDRKRKRKKPDSAKGHYANQEDAWVMRPAASPLLLRLHNELQVLSEAKEALVERLQEQYGLSGLSLRWTPGLGHICHTKSKSSLARTTDFQILSSSKSTQSFEHPEWTRLGRDMDHVRHQIQAEERQILLQLRDQVIHNLIRLRRNASILDELDVTCSFATLAKEQALVRPRLNNSHTHHIEGGRHPSVQRNLDDQGRSFVANDCLVGDEERVWLITGPNMAGKSTFLRQNALITIMAQMGCFVPAERATIGIVDQIFTRIGSADNLFSDQSTFMIEMLESATILKHATSRSFVIMDEIGRGTTHRDGAAIAFSCLYHLCLVNRCRTLFATHFHELVDACRSLDSVGYFCTDVLESSDGRFTYAYRLRKGVNTSSHALKVARLAGMPDLAIQKAQEYLNANAASQS